MTFSPGLHTPNDDQVMLPSYNGDVDQILRRLAPRIWLCRDDDSINLSESPLVSGVVAKMPSRENKGPGVMRCDAKPNENSATTGGRPLWWGEGFAIASSRIERAVSEGALSLFAKTDRRPLHLFPRLCPVSLKCAQEGKGVP